MIPVATLEPSVENPAAGATSSTASHSEGAFMQHEQAQRRVLPFTAFQAFQELEVFCEVFLE